MCKLTQWELMMKIHFKHQNDYKIVLQWTTFYYRCFYHLLISTKQYFKDFSVTDFDVKLLKHQFPKYSKLTCASL